MPYEYLSSKASPIHISEFKLSHSLTLGELSLSLSLRERWVTQKTMQLVSHSQQYADLWSLSWATKSTGIDRGLESCCTTSQTEKLCWPIWKPTFFSQVWCGGQIASGSHDSVLLRSLAVCSKTEWIHHVPTKATLPRSCSSQGPSLVGARGPSCETGASPLGNSDWRICCAPRHCQQLLEFYK